jgi:hypothetical protein
VKSADPNHAFWPSLKSAMGAVDIELANFAKQTEATLSQRIAAEKAPRTPDVTVIPRRNPAPTGPDTRPGG